MTQSKELAIATSKTFRAQADGVSKAMRALGRAFTMEFKADLARVLKCCPVLRGRNCGK